MSVENEKRLLKRTSEELVRKYGAQNAVLGKKVKTLVICTSIRYVRIAMCISSAVPKWFFREMSEPKTILDKTCVDIKQDVLNEVSELLLALVAETTWFYWTHSR